jgi:hypothetical protein
MQFFLIVCVASISFAQLEFDKSSLAKEDAKIVDNLVDAIALKSNATNPHPFNALVTAYLAAPSDSLASEIKVYLLVWKWNHSKYLKPIIARHSALSKFSDVSENLESLSVLASQVLDKKQDIINYSFDDVWRQKAATALKRAKDKKNKFKIRALKGLEKLIHSE